MMKTLYLVRHANALSNNSKIADHERPLDLLGEQDASSMGKRLRERTRLPTHIISSSAMRAKTTASILAETINYPIHDLIIDERLYEAESNEVLTIIHEFDNEVQCAMLIGHNPTFTYLINALSGSQISNVPTCGLATLRFSSNTWSKVGHVQGELLDFDYPKKDTD